MRELDPGYTSTADSLDEVTWCRLLDQFGDANIYQTWSYDEVRGGRGKISHLLLKKHDQVIAVAQSRIVRVPVVNAGIAYVRWGPLWQRRDDESDPETFRQAIRALRNEYVGRRGLVLRLYPVLFRESSSGFATILAEEGFSALANERVDRTLLFDLRPPVSDLRANLRPHWHRYLKVAERNGLEIIEGADDHLFEMFVNIYKEMVSRKKFAEPNDIKEFRAIQRQLPAPYKMKIMLCKADDKICAGVVCSAIGNTGIYLFGATSDAGLKKRGSYLLHWRVIEWLKNNGFSTYDLNGIDPVLNPGTYKFKADLCGNNGKDRYFMGRFESSVRGFSHSFVSWGETFRAMRRTLNHKRTTSGPRPAVSDSQPLEGVGVIEERSL
ncbi:MAG TPA: peptidoglycan bridge formation glycyltransferase FemA/FemB family protein [Candidatus Dormibacteraeota bacterium]|nr:peptidoglycan bridge formation glycyltransferase FemA/FemB family protein [Candidatus Dormibacteraeota bacterium]